MSHLITQMQPKCVPQVTHCTIQNDDNESETILPADSIWPMLQIQLHALTYWHAQLPVLYIEDRFSIKLSENVQKLVPFSPQFYRNLAEFLTI